MARPSRLPIKYPILSPSTAPAHADSIRGRSDNSPRPARIEAKTSTDSPGRGSPRDSNVRMIMTAAAPYAWTRGSRFPRKCSISTNNAIGAPPGHALGVGRLSTRSRLYANPLIEHDFFANPARFKQTYLRKAWRDKKWGFASGPRSLADRERISAQAARRLRASTQSAFSREPEPAVRRNASAGFLRPPCPVRHAASVSPKL